MSDPYDNLTDGLSTPLVNAAAVVPDDGADLATITRCIWIGAAGDLRVMMARGAAPVTFPNMTAGWHPLRVSRIYATGTTAAEIVATW